MDSKPKATGGNKRSSSDTITEAQRVFARNAVILFELGRYAECLNELSKIRAERPNDVRFTHNVAIANFYMSGLRDVNEFETQLSTICEKSGININDVGSLDDARNCYLYFNKAILLFHKHQYSTTQHYLEKLFTFVENVDDSLRKAITILLLEVYLRMHHPEKSLAVVLYVEKTPFFKLNSHIGGQQAAESVSNSADVILSQDQMFAFKMKIMMYKCRCYLKLRDVQNIEISLEAFAQCPVKAVFKNYHQSDDQYNIRCTNMRICERMFRAYSEYMRGAARSCVQTLASISSLQDTFAFTGDSPKTALYNNLGCIHLYIRKPTIASLYFMKARDQNALERTPIIVEGEEISKPLYLLGSNKLPEIMYNLGLSLLVSGRPIEAFDCLTSAVQVYYMNPKLWVRLAECCIMVHKDGNSQDFDFLNQRQNVLKNVFGEGKHRKLVLNLQLVDNNAKYNTNAGSSAIPTTSLEFASLCLRNALFLISSSKSVDCSPSNPITERQLFNLKASILVAHAYVALCLGDPIVAIRNIKNLFEVSEFSHINKMLGHLYLAEAYIMMDRIPEALEHLKPDLNRCTLSPDSFPTWQSNPFVPDNVESACAVFQYNLAVVRALNGEYAKASELLKKVWVQKLNCIQVPIQIVSLSLYIELFMGHANVARNIIRQNCPQYYNPPS